MGFRYDGEADPMTTIASSDRTPTQFALRDLLEFTTVAAVIAALAGTIGLTAATLLLLFSAAIACRLGGLALLLLMLAMSATDGWKPGSSVDGTGIDRQFIVFGLAALAALWRRLAANGPTKRCQETSRKAAATESANAKPQAWV
jgi:hypothetical protein